MPEWSGAVMPDWKAYVAERLRLPGLKADREAELVEDLAQQLDDLYRAALEHGATSDEAAAAAQREIEDWDALARAIVESDGSHRVTLDQRALDRLERRPSAGSRALRLLSELAADVLHARRL